MEKNTYDLQIVGVFFFVEINMVYIIMTLVLRHSQINDLQIDVNDNAVSPVLEGGEEEEEEDDVVEGITEDTDEEYVPVEEPVSSVPSTSAARKCKVQSRTDHLASSSTLEEDSKKDSVQCPICDKSFKSKYYLKVHNRYTTYIWYFPL